MRFIILYLWFVVVSLGAQGRDSDVLAISRFTITLPASGVYAPWRPDQESSFHRAGEIIAIRKGAFNYRSWSGPAEGGQSPLYSGTLTIRKDRIFLDHPEIAHPYRVAGVADGISVLLKWRGYEDWRKTGKLSPSEILFLQN